MGMLIDGIGVTSTIDSSGEQILVESHDVSELNNGKCVFNFEHLNDSPENFLGRITYAIKILKESDCENDRQRKYYDFVKGPFVYIKGELFDDEEHAGAIAMAAIIRFSHKRNEKLLVGFSVEGSTLERDENILTRTISRRYAITFRPCNKQAIAGVLKDSQSDKDISDQIKKFINYDNPVIGEFNLDTCILEDDSSGDSIEDIRKSLNALKKTLTAGGYNVAPSQLSGGAALGVEDNHSTRKTKATVKQILSTWDRKRPLREVLKAALPEVSDDYIDHFEQVAQELSLKKNMKPLVRIDASHSSNKNANEDQKKLITGLYHDPSSQFGKGLENEPRSKMFKLKNDAGQDVLTKLPSEDYSGSGHDPSMAATDYYHMAKNFFGLGDHVPVTNHFDHPSIESGTKSIQAQEYKPNAKTFWHPESDDIQRKSRESGDSHKLAIMDMVTNGDTDRHFGNVLFDKGKMIHIDNDDAFNYGTRNTPAAYFDDSRNESGLINGIGNDTIHKDANTWLQSLDPKVMIQHMKKQGMDRDQIKEATRRLLLLKKEAPNGRTMRMLHDIVNGKWEENEGAA